MWEERLRMNLLFRKLTGTSLGASSFLSIMSLSFEDNASVSLLLSPWLRRDPKTEKQQKLSAATSLVILSLY